MAAIDPAETLGAEQSARLAEFARACKAAARVVALYPGTHPAIQTALHRVAETADRLRDGGAAVLTVLPDGLLLDGRSVARADSALGELAALLHAHSIGELRIAGSLPPASWHTFLGLLARSPEQVRDDGGIARAWLAAGGGPIELRQIDYAEVLRERAGGLESEWQRIIGNYLEGELSDLDDAAMAALYEVATDASRFRDFTEQLVAKASDGGRRGRREAVLRILQALADYVAREHPEQLDRILHQITGAVPRLTPDMLVTLITTGVPGSDGMPVTGIDLPGEIRARLSDSTVAQFVAQSVARDHGATARLAEAFQALVPESDRGRLLALAEAEARQLPIGRQPEFSDLWRSASELLTSYSDAQYVSDEYGRELARSRAHALEVERTSDDPPERLSAWLSTVSESAVRRLDHQLLIDLLTIERRPTAWATVLELALQSIDRAVLAGQIADAQQLLDILVENGRDGAPFADAARAGLARLRTGSLMRHVVLFIRQARDADVPAVSAFCRTLGPTVIGPLAEALATEEGSAVKRLRDVLLGFGAAGRAYVNELRSSANPAVRRTAVELLRAFGGAEALPDLASLLDDAEPGVQREALRAIVQIGTDEAYSTLRVALESADTQTRDAIMQVLLSTRDERAAPLFVYILDHSDHRGALEPVYRSAIEALGKLGVGDEDAVRALTRVLYRNEWWAPFRTARLRLAAALALRACGSEQAAAALDEAAAHGTRGVRRAARAALQAMPPVRRTS
jgi:hypothetical protein